MQMNKLKQIILQLPEYLLILSVLFYWFSTSNLFNPVAISILLFLIIQIVFKNRIIGISIGVILIIASLYLLLALLSEFHEFPEYNKEAFTFLMIGFIYFFSTIIVSMIMLYKSVRKS